MNYLVSINVIGSGNRIANKNGVPLLFSWDGSGSAVEAVKADETLFSFLNASKLFADVNEYCASKISMFWFQQDESGAESYKECAAALQEWYPLESVKSRDGVSCADAALKEALDYVYRMSFGESFEFTGDLQSDLNAVYAKVHEKYASKLTADTFINGLRSWCQNYCSALSPENVNYIIGEAESWMR